MLPGSVASAPELQRDKIGVPLSWLWLAIVPTDPSLELGEGDWRLAMALRFGVNLLPAMRASRSCGCRSSHPDFFSNHMMVCGHSGGMISFRHNTCRDVLVGNVLVAAGALVTAEELCVCPGAENRYADFFFTFHSQPRTFADLVVVAPFVASHEAASGQKGPTRWWWNVKGIGRDSTEAMLVPPGSVLGLAVDVFGHPGPSLSWLLWSTALRRLSDAPSGLAKTSSSLLVHPLERGSSAGQC